ncbi:tetratricopeptide repeat protein [Robiginitalea aurantiaca]|uniref:Tetratricopeptide repeat protein n=1 Tax=Robiginitalea aurantiaca TaxID=3056915 RepID=A0ABT7WDI3_9FLAO|nr:tetratricopeptide repeat protein [Robiginitalea aurantiaca]MDM9630977.1 tetratricopeptide repeat protein [Robiginitalea aurantiaca]
MEKPYIALAVLLMATAICLGQETMVYTHDESPYQQAFNLYRNKQYQAAQTLFESVLATSQDEQTRANSAYYIANAAVRLNQLGADRLMESFVADYPTSTKRNSAFMDVADYYFENGRYPYALKWYNKADPGSLNRSERERFDFRKGYALFNSNKPGQAEPYFQRVSSSAEYGSQAKYYLGYIAYQQDDYQEANERFDQIADQEVLQEKLSYYQADMNFKLGNFREAITQAEQQLSKANRREVSELNKIIGESYFNLKEYEAAAPYLEQYQGKGGKWSNTDYYQLGYAYYKQGDYANAIGQFNKIVDGADFVAQNAYYHLAECYLNLDKKQEALNAFRNASQMEFDAEIRKDAYLNYARLSYEQGNAYESVSEVLQGYLQTYPGDGNEAEIKKLLIDSYLSTRDFKGALALLEEKESFASPETYQKVAYYRGVEVFLEEDYQGALALFERSLSRGGDPVFKARAQYWKAEAAFELGRFEEALTAYTQFGKLPASSALEEYKGLDYQIGYAHFKRNDYENAARYFEKYTRSGGTGDQNADALMRLGDSYFVSSSYRDAIAAYDRARSSGSPDPDYADFQKALSLGFLGREGEKQQALTAFIDAYPKSTLKDDAYLELGNSFVQEGKSSEAIAAYDRLISEYRMSSLVPTAMMRKGLVFYNRGDNREALEVFKEVTRVYPDSDQAVQAVQTAKLIYVDLGEVDAYAQWVRGLDYVEVSDQELETASYDAAEKQYLDGNATRAEKAFEAYLKEFPGGSRHIEARFRLATLYFQRGETEKALEPFKMVAESGTGEMAEQALTRVCEILISGEGYPQAIPYLKRLEAIADIPQNRTYAQSNLMKAYFENKQYSEVLEYAQKVLDNPSLNDRIRSDARLMTARAAMETGDATKAREAYALVLETGGREAKAEALYYKAFFEREDGDPEASNASLQELVRDYATYRQWGGKGLIVMALNYDQLDDAFQATYILESVVANFEDFPDIASEAGRELSKIKTREATRNASIKPEGN